MQWLWWVSGVSLLLAGMAWAASRSNARQLAQLSERYWALKFEHGELKARLKALAPTPEEQAAAQPPVQQTFVPLSTMKRPVS